MTAPNIFRMERRFDHGDRLTYSWAYLLDVVPAVRERCRLAVVQAPDWRTVTDDVLGMPRTSARRVPPTCSVATWARCSRASRIA